MTTHPGVAHRLGGRALPGAVAILVDLTQLRRLEVVRRDFVANASHELKTPLTSIRGYAETLLADRSLPEELRQDFLRTIHDNAARLHRLVEDLLDLSRLESGGWRPDLRSVDVAEVATEVWDGLRHIGESKSIAFSIDAGSRPAALADPIAVRQILANLIDNAIRYTPDGGRITVRVSEASGPVRRTPIASSPPREPQPRPADDARWIVVEVADNGVGIPATPSSRLRAVLPRGPSRSGRRRHRPPAISTPRRRNGRRRRRRERARQREHVPLAPRRGADAKQGARSRCAHAFTRLRSAATRLGLTDARA